jgi:hypothetical protein
VRAAFFLVSLLTVVGLYLLSCAYFSFEAAFLTAFVFLNYWGFGRHAASGPRAKTIMLLFVVLALLLTARRRWFWAGCCGSLAFLTWQPTAFYAAITMLLSIVQSKQGRDRAQNALSAVVGTLVPIVIVGAYFFSKGAVLDLASGAITFNVLHLERDDVSLLHNVRRIRLAMHAGYETMFIPLLLGFVAICAIFLWRLALHGNRIWSWVSRDHFAGLLLSFTMQFLWSLVDFQGYPDFYVFLPCAALGFGWLLHLSLLGLTENKRITPMIRRIVFVGLCVTLIAGATLNYRRTASKELELQRAWAQDILSTYGDDVRLVSVGIPQALVLLHKTNPNPYVFIINGIDNRIDATTPGGFDGWLASLERYDPALILYGAPRGRHIPRLDAWLESRYHRETVGEWVVYVKL